MFISFFKPKCLRTDTNVQNLILPFCIYEAIIFRMLFKTKKELLSLFNAVNSTNYESEDELEIVTLENAVYMSMKNDVSCLLDMNLQIYEHQSTINPNMPLRNLMYITKQLEKLIVKKDLYGRKLITLPNPRFIVFYNGTDKQPETDTLYLSSAYEHKEKEVNLELKVLQLNINKGYNEDIKSKCPSLFQYMQYVDILRENRKTHPLKEAVIITVDYCIKHDILKDFLLANKSEVISMSIFEYDEELHKKTLRAEGYEDGFKEGFDSGHKEGFDSGHKEGFDSGHKEGFEAGVASKESENQRLREEIKELKKQLNSK